MTIVITIIIPIITVVVKGLLADDNDHKKIKVNEINDNNNHDYNDDYNNYKRTMMIEILDLV